MRDHDREYGLPRARQSFPKAFAWLAALMTSLNFRFSQVADLKFPDACPYCEASPCECSSSQSRYAMNQALRGRVREKHSTVPEASGRSFNHYQDMFRTIYGDRNREAGLDSVAANSLGAVAQFTDAFLRLRSLKEANAVDIIPLELADQLAWFMALLNSFTATEPFDLPSAFAEMYGGACPKCGGAICACPDVEQELRLIGWREFK